MPATLRKEGERLVLDLSTARGMEFKDALAKIKEVPGRRYDPENKLWSVEATVGNADRVIHSIQPNVPEDVQAWVKQSRVKENEALTSPLPDDAALVGPLKDTLYPFQRAFVDLAVREKHIINADDMGLGKTIQALATVLEYQHRHGVDDGTGLVMPDGPKLIVCPNSVKGVWAREIEQWVMPHFPDTVYQIVDASTPKARHKQIADTITENGWVITNYEQLRVHRLEAKRRDGGKRRIEALKQPLFELPFLAQVSPSYDDLQKLTVIEKARKAKARTDWFAVILDEAHRAKNRRAKQSKGVHRLRADLMLALTGTPLMNTPDELWSILHALYPQQYTSYVRFENEYVDYIEGYFGKIITGVKNPDALRFELRDRLVRRTKGQVLDLPAKTRVIVPVKLSAPERKLYAQAEQEVFLDVLKGAEEGESTAQAMVKALKAGGGLTDLLKIPNGAARLVRLQQALEHPANLLAAKSESLAQAVRDIKVDDSTKMDDCEEIIFDNVQEQHVVFCKFVPSTAIFAERLRAHAKRLGMDDFVVATYTGEVSSAERTSIEDAFQRGEINVIVGTLGAMKEGITLTAANTEHFLTRDWTPAVNDQAEDRCYRVGQTKNVTIYIYEAENTADDGKVRPANDLKRRIVGTILVSDEVKEKKHK